MPCHLSPSFPIDAPFIWICSLFLFSRSNSPLHIPPCRMSADATAPTLLFPSLLLPLALTTPSIVNLPLLPPNSSFFGHPPAVSLDPHFSFVTFLSLGPCRAAKNLIFPGKHLRGSPAPLQMQILIIFFAPCSVLSLSLPLTFSQPTFPRFPVTLLIYVALFSFPVFFFYRTPPLPSSYAHDLTLQNFIRTL